MEYKVLTWTCYRTDCGQTLVLSLVLILSVADRVLHGAEAAGALVKAGDNSSRLCGCFCKPLL